MHLPGAQSPGLSLAIWVSPFSSPEPSFHPAAIAQLSTGTNYLFVAPLAPQVLLNSAAPRTSPAAGQPGLRLLCSPLLRCPSGAWWGFASWSPLHWWGQGSILCPGRSIGTLVPMGTGGAMQTGKCTWFLPRDSRCCFAADKRCMLKGARRPHDCRSLARSPNHILCWVDSKARRGVLQGQVLPCLTHYLSQFVTHSRCSANTCWLVEQPGIHLALWGGTQRLMLVESSHLLSHPMVRM